MSTDLTLKQNLSLFHLLFYRKTRGNLIPTILENNVYVRVKNVLPLFRSLGGSTVTLTTSEKVCHEKFEEFE